MVPPGEKFEPAPNKKGVPTEYTVTQYASLISESNSGHSEVFAFYTTTDQLVLCMVFDNKSAQDSVTGAGYDDSKHTMDIQIGNTTYAFPVVAESIPDSKFQLKFTMLNNDGTSTETTKTIASNGKAKYIYYVIFDPGVAKSMGDVKGIQKIDMAGGQNPLQDVSSINITYDGVTARKKWDDNGNKWGLRPDYVEMTLYKDGTKVASTATTPNPIRLSANGTTGDEWAYTWKVPAGHYTVKETAISNNAEYYTQEWDTDTTTTNILKTYKVAYQYVEKPSGVTVPNPPATTEYVYKSAVTLESPVVPPKGYKFEGWYADQACTTPAGSIASIDKDYTFYGKIVPDTADYTVNYYWLGDKDNTSATPLDMVNGSGTIGDTFTAESKSFDGYTIVPNQTLSQKIVATASQNVINVYYYKNVTLTAKNANKAYDGTPLTQADFDVTGADKSEFSVTMTADSAQTEVGEHYNRIGKVNNETIGAPSTTPTAIGNYMVTTVDGLLTVSQDATPIIITANSNEKTYNGTALTDNGYTYTQGVLQDGDVLTAVVEGSRTDVGTAENKVTSYKVMRGTTDVTGAYTFGTPVNGELKVNPKSVTITAGSDEKTYDGDPLTCSTANASALETGDTHKFTVVMTADSTITEPGTQPNVIASVDGVAITATTGKTDVEIGNYRVTVVDGLLTVHEYAEPITVTTTGYNGIYDGKSHGATVTLDGLPTVYTVERKESSASATHVTSGVKATADLLVIKNAQGTDVTDQLNLTYVDGSIVITPATLTVVMPSKTKTYDGEPLTEAGSMSGLVNSETATFTTTGVQATVGKSSNTYTITWDGTAQKSDYTITETIGTLEVEKATITATAIAQSYTYDGEKKTATVEVSGVPANMTVTEASSNANATHVSDGVVTAHADNVKIEKDGKDVTPNFEIIYVDDALEIIPAELTIVTAGATKTYDGKPLTAGGTITGLVNDSDATLVTTGVQIDVGKSSNTYTIDWADGVEETDYKVVSETIGDLEVLPMKVTVTVIGGSKDYTGKPQTATVQVTGLTDSYTVALATSDASVTHVSEGAVKAYADHIQILDENGKDITDNLDIEYVDGWLEIIPVKLTVVTPDKTKTYDGEPLTEAGSITGFVNGESATFQTTGVQTTVGKSSNTYTITWDGTAQKSDYTITESIGTLEVKKATITATAIAESHVYTGETFGATVEVTDVPTGLTVAEAKSNASATHVTDGVVTAHADSVIIKQNDVDVTGNFEIIYVDDALEITPAELTITTPDDSKIYDGTELKKDGKIEGFVNNETASFATTGVQITVGKSSNTYTLTWDGTAKESDYTLTESIGTLEVKKATITATAIAESHVYTGETFGATVEVTDVPTGLTVAEAKSNASATHVTDGVVTAHADSVIIKQNDVDVTGNFEIIYVDDALEITPAELTITTPDDSKIYDGTELKKDGKIEGFVNNETASFATTGVRITVGKSSNTYTLTWDGTARESDYTITENIGTLEVKKATITATTTGGSITYTGKNHFATVEVTNVPTVLKVAVATSDASATHVSEGKIPAHADHVVIADANDKDVTDNFDIIYVDDTLEIIPAELTVTTPDDSKIYNGTELRKAGQIKGFVNEETATFTTTGVQIAVGQSSNTYTIDWNGAATETDYFITENIGTLTVYENDAEIVVTTTGGSFTYDGKAHGATVEVTGVPTGYRATVYTSDAKAIHVYDSVVPATADHLTILNAQDEDVTDQLNIRYVDGAIEITKAMLTVTTPNASKDYDGTPLTAEGSLNGLIEGETNTFETTGTQTDADESSNTWNITWDGTADERDYEITDTVGTLTVLPRELTLTAESDQKVYDGTPLTNGTHTVDGIAATDAHLFTVKMTEDSTITETGAKDNTIAEVDGVAVKPTETTRVGNYLVSIATGKLTIEQKPVKLSTESAEFEYDGLTHGKPGVSGTDGFLSADGIIAETPETVLNAGESKTNVIKLTDPNGKLKNYAVTEEPGTISIYANDGVTVTLTENSGTGTYSGKEQKVTGYTVSSILLDGETTDLYTVKDFAFIGTEKDMTAAGVNAGTYEMVLRPELFENNNPNFTDVTFVIEDGELQIGPKTVTLTSADDGRPYNSEPLTNGTVVAEGFVEGEGATYTVTGTQTLVGESDNVFTFSLNDNTLASNYDIQTVFGHLTVTDDTDDAYVIEKTHEEREYRVGDQMIFEIRATNIYDRPMTMTVAEQKGVTLVDASRYTNVAPGETIIVRAKHKVAAADVKNGKYDNTAEVQFTGGSTYTATDRAETVSNYRVTVHYWYDRIGGEPAGKTFDKVYWYGETYDIKSPMVAGYTADKTRLTGTVEDAVTLDVVYKPAVYTLTVRFISTEGKEFFRAYTEKLKMGEAYQVEVPTRDGYTTPSKAVQGFMPAHDLDVKIIYIPENDGTWEDPYIVIDDYINSLGLGFVGLNVGLRSE